MQIRHVHPRRQRRPRLIESNVPILPDPQQLKIDPADLADPTLIILAMFLQIGNRSVGNKNAAAGSLTKNVTTRNPCYNRRVFFYGICCRSF